MANSLQPVAVRRAAFHLIHHINWCRRRRKTPARKKKRHRLHDGFERDDDVFGRQLHALCDFRDVRLFAVFVRQLLFDLHGAHAVSRMERLTRTALLSRRKRFTSPYMIGTP